MDTSNNGMIREDLYPGSRRIEVAEEEANHHFAPDREQDGQEKDKKSQPKKRRVPVQWIIIAIVVLLVAGYFGFRYWQYASTHESADDAYTTNHIHQISPRINGTVERVLVDDNVRVKAGQVLVQLDPRDYEVSLRQAQANLSSAEAAVTEGEAQMEVAKASVGQAEGSEASAQASADNANADQKRDAELLKTHVISPQDMDHANQAARTNNAALQSAKKQVAGAEAQVSLADAQVKAAHAQVQQAQEAVKQAELNLSYTNIVSPDRWPGRATHCRERKPGPTRAGAHGDLGTRCLGGGKSERNSNGKSPRRPASCDQNRFFSSPKIQRLGG